MWITRHAPTERGAGVRVRVRARVHHTGRPGIGGCIGAGVRGRVLDHQDGTVGSPAGLERAHIDRRIDRRRYRGRIGRSEIARPLIPTCADEQQHRRSKGAWTGAVHGWRLAAPVPPPWYAGIGHTRELYATEGGEPGNDLPTLRARLRIALAHRVRRRKAGPAHPRCAS